MKLVSAGILLILFCSCNGYKNERNASIVKNNNQLFIKLTGKRVLKPSSVSDLVRQKTYDDSLLIPIPGLKDGVIKGENIPVQEGNYSYKGEVVIKGDNLKINLFLDNYDDKRLDSLSWNGEYKFIRR